MYKPIFQYTVGISYVIYQWVKLTCEKSRVGDVELGNGGNAAQTRGRDGYIRSLFNFEKKTPLKYTYKRKIEIKGIVLLLFQGLYKRTYGKQGSWYILCLFLNLENAYSMNLKKILVNVGRPEQMTMTTLPSPLSSHSYKIKRVPIIYTRPCSYG